MAKTIGIDCRLSGQQHAGIGRYIENLIIRLPSLTKKINWVYFFNNQTQAQAITEQLAKDSQTSQAAIKTVIAPIRHYSLKEQLLWPKIIKQEQLDLLHVPHFNIPLTGGTPLTVTIHDLLWHQQIGPAATTLSPIKYYLKYLGYRFVTRQAIKQALAIFTPAQTIKNTINNFFPGTKDKIVVTKEGIGHKFQQTQQRLSQQPKKLQKQLKGQAKSKQLIYVGSLYPHKNIALVLRALTVLPNFHLKIVGSRNVFVKRIKTKVAQMNLTNQVKFAGFLPDQELISELQSSFALVQPSLSEGFGLTGIEAMACGLPVLASNIPIFHEIYQQAPLFINPQQENSLLKAIHQLKTLESRTKHTKMGLKLVKEYDWSTMARQTLQHFLKLVKA